MSKMYWDAAISVRNDRLDDQHKTWFGLLNKLHDSMLHDEPDDLVHTKIECLRAMLDYARGHFAAEEAYMREHGYAGLAEHIKLHQRFVDYALSLEKDLQAGRVILGSSVIGFMQEWVADHIASEDLKYAAFIG